MDPKTISHFEIFQSLELFSGPFFCVVFSTWRYLNFEKTVFTLKKSMTIISTLIPHYLKIITAINEKRSSLFAHTLNEINEINEIADMSRCESIWIDKHIVLFINYFTLFWFHIIVLCKLIHNTFFHLKNIENLLWKMKNTQQFLNYFWL